MYDESVMLLRAVILLEVFFLYSPEYTFARRLSVDILVASSNFVASYFFTRRRWEPCKYEIDVYCTSRGLNLALYNSIIRSLGVSLLLD